MGIRVSHERARGCGFRKQGGTYLVAPRPSEPCPLLPVEMSVCPCCGVGIKPARGWTWVDADPFLDAHFVATGGEVDTREWADEEGGRMLTARRAHGSDEHTLVCPFAYKLGRAGLIWIGEAFYKTPQEFMREAADMGISRRITAVPRDFKLGETWVLLGHRKAIPAGYRLKGEKQVYETLAELREEHGEVEAKKIEDAFKPGIITAFKPTAVEYVVRPEDEHDEEFLESLEKRGITPVKVVPVQAEEMLPL